MTAVDAVFASELGGLDPYEILGLEASRVETHVATFDDAAWEAPTPCPDWDRHDLVAHLAASELYNNATVTDSLDELLATMAAEGITDVHSFNEWGVRTRRGRPRSEILDEWRAGSSKTREALQERDGTDIPTLAGSYPARQQAWHLAVELAAHADDLGVPVTDDEAEERVAWRARAARAISTEEARGATFVPAGADTTVTVGDESALLDDATLVAASVDRLTADHPLSAAVRDGLRPKY